MNHPWRRTLRTAIVIATLGLGAIAVSGCAAALIGGAAVGGYQVGKDKRPASQIARDSAITADVKSRLIADTEVKALDINVDTYEGVVYLKGEVATAAQRAQAERVARATSGIKGVRNELRLR